MARVKPLFDKSDYLRGRQTAVDPRNKGLIGVGGGLVYFRGSEARRGLDSVDADYVVFDEYDTLVHENIPDAERRVSGALSAGLIRRVGVPTVPDWGIARLYDQSDQRRWMVRCARCGHWQALDFEANVDKMTATIVCAQCARPLDVGVGEWIPTFPDRLVRGYHVTRLMAPRADIAAIVLAAERGAGFERQAFFNKDLGIPWAPEEGRLSRSVLAAAQSLGGFATAEVYSGDNLVTMGVDVASTRALHVRISENLPDGRRKGIFIGRADGFDELDTLMNRFRIQMAAIDHLPEGRLARAFAERFPGRVHLVAYNTTLHPRGPNLLTVDSDMRFATIRRLEVIDAMTEQFRLQKNLLPRNLPEEYFDHLQALVRVAERDPVGNQRTLYRSTGPDDYAHAEIYDVAAHLLWEHQQYVDAALRETSIPIDEVISFERSNASLYGETPEYHPGGREDLSAYGDDWHD